MLWYRSTAKCIGYIQERACGGVMPLIETVEMTRPEVGRKHVRYEGLSRNALLRACARGR